MENSLCEQKTTAHHRARVIPNSTITPEGFMKMKPPGVFFTFRHDQTSCNFENISCISANSKLFFAVFYTKKPETPSFSAHRGV